MLHLQFFNWQRTGLFLLLFALPFFLFSQGNSSNHEKFIKTSTLADLNLDAAQNEKYLNLANNPRYKEITPITLGDLSSSQKNGFLIFTIPGEKRTFTARGHRVEAFENGDYDWYATLMPKTKQAGTIHIIKNESTVFGQINIDKEVYLIQDLGQDQHILIHLSETENAEEYHTRQDNESRITENEVSQSRSTCNETDIRVLVLYTTAANNAVNNILRTSQLATSQINNGLNNSSISFSTARFQLAAVRPLSSFVESNDIDDDLNDLGGLVATSNSTVNSERQTYQADLIVLLTDGNYTNNNGTFLGIAPNPTNVGNPLQGYCIVEADAATGDLTFAHEVGHLLGCGHENLGSPAATSFAHGRVFNASGEKGTIVARTGSATTRILHFSNPDVQFNGVNTGIVDSRDNARQIENIANTVACYLPYNAPMTVSISGTTTGSNSTTGFWSANVANCSTISNYKWEMSTDGFNYSTVANGSSASTLSMQFPQNTDFHLRLTVTCSDGQVKTNFLTVYNSDAQNCNPCAKIAPNIGIDIIQVDKEYTFENGTVNIFPNPVNNQISLTIILKKSSHVSLNLYDAYGKQISSPLTEILAKGDHTFSEDVSRQPNGIYYYQIQIDDKVLSKKIIIQK